MRLTLLIALLVFVTALKAQIYMPGSFAGNTYRGNLYNNIHVSDSSSKKNWSLSPYGAISSGFMLFNGGSASFIAAPLGLQLNRRLNNNLYAFAGVSVAPAYVNFRPSFMTNDFDKTTRSSTYLKSGNFGMYSRAELGLQYINDEKTFSISGSIGIERSGYPAFQYGPMSNNTVIKQQVMPANR